MDKELKKRLEEAARVGFREGFKSGAERGYKEAVAQAKEWLSKQKSWDYYDDCPCKLLTKEGIADFEADMLKLWEEQK